MDVFFIEAMVAEMQVLLRGASVKKIHQPDADTLILRLWNGRRELRLRIAATVGSTAVYFTSRPWINPPTPLRFCQLLRSRLAVLRSIHQPHDERVVILDFDGHDGMGYRLILELYGRRPNMILCDAEHRIVDVLHRRDGAPEQQTYLKGAFWREPEKSQAYGFHDAADHLDASLGSKDLIGWLKNNVTPMTPFWARIIAGRICDGEDPAAVFADLLAQRSARERSVFIKEFEGRPRLWAFRPSSPDGEAVEEFASPSEAADHFYARYVVGGSGGDQAKLLRIAQRALTKVENRLERLHREKAAVGDGEHFQQLGQLLMANFYRVHKGMKEIEVEDYFKGNEKVRIPLDPALSPSENADRLFNKCKKMRRGKGHVERRLEESSAEKQWLEALVLTLGAIGSGEELAVVEEEMREYRLIPPTHKKAVRRPPSGRPGLREALTPGGYALQWGTNNRANDYLVKHVCRPDDLWFHALDRPGCHLVLKKNRRDQTVPESDILFAAGLAAGYSRAAGEGLADVMVAEGRAVHKPKGALPGLVHVNNYRTVRVVPRREP